MIVIDTVAAENKAAGNTHERSSETHLKTAAKCIAFVGRELQEGIFLFLINDKLSPVDEAIQYVHEQRIQLFAMGGAAP